MRSTGVFLLVFGLLVASVCPVVSGEVTEIARNLEDTDPAVRRSTLRLLEPYAAEAVPFIEQVLIADEDAEVRWAAIQSLQRIGALGGNGLFLGLQDAEANVRAGAASAFARLVVLPAQVVPQLIHLLEDEASQVRLEAANALGRYGSYAKDALGALALALGDQDFRVQRSAQRALQMIDRDFSPQKDILVALASDQPDRWQAAVRALPLVAFAESDLERLQFFLADERAEVRAATLQAMQNMDLIATELLPSVGAAVSATLHDENCEVQREALNLLVSFGSAAKVFVDDLLTIPERSPNWSRVVSLLVAIGEPAAVGVAERLAAETEPLKVREFVRLAGAIGWPADRLVEEIRFLISDQTMRAPAVAALEALDVDSTLWYQLALAAEGKELSVDEVQRRTKRSSYRVGVLNEGDLTTQTLPLLLGLGYDAEFVSVDQIQSGVLSQYDCFLLWAESWSVAEVEMDVRAFLADGRDLVALGTNGFVFHLDQRPRDGQVLQLPQAYKDYSVYRMLDIASIRSWDSPLLSMEQPIHLSGSYEGISAIGFEYPNQSRFVPMLAALDSFGRHQGWAAGILVNYSGSYRHSHWGFMGIQSPEFYMQPEYAQALECMLDQFRDGQLGEQALEANREALARRIPLESPPPPAVRINAAGTGFEYEDGRPFFMIGANVSGIAGFRYQGWNPDVLEANFRLLHRAGINALRIRTPITSALYTNTSNLEALIELARRYGVYLLVEIGPGPNYGVTAEQIRSNATAAATMFKDEPIVLGYDLDNEPYSWEIARVQLDDGRTLGSAQGFSNQDQLRRWVDPGHLSVFENLEGLVQDPPTPLLRRALAEMNGVLGGWMDLAIESIRAIDPDTPITVGYNSHFIAYEANERLDFVSNHMYGPTWARTHPEGPFNPIGYKAVMASLTTMDRLAAMWPHKPISIGEFGYSNGDFWDGEFVDPHSSAVVEMTHFLYSLSQNYSGLMKWRIADMEPMSTLATFRSLDDEENQLRQRRFGMYYFDGTESGGAKPIVHAMAFFSQFVNAGNSGGETHIAESRSKNGLFANYVYRHQQALFVGDVEYTDPALSFRSSNGLPVNFMVWWDQEALYLMATGDTEFRFDAGAVDWTGPLLEIEGLAAEISLDGKVVSGMLLEGEVITLPR